MFVDALAHFWPQIILLGCMTFRFLFVLAKYGESTNETYGALDLVGLGFAVFLLYMGGFFS